VPGLGPACVFRDRRTDETSGGTPAKPPVLRRRTLRWAAVAVLTLIVWGTNGPLGADGRAWLRPVDSWRWSPAWTPSGWDDVATNFVVYLPVGFAFRLLVRRRGRAGWADFTLAIALSATLSYLTELAQQAMPARVSSLTDVAVNTAAAACGALAAPVAQRGLRAVHAAAHAHLSPWLRNTAPLRAGAKLALLVALPLVVIAVLPSHLPSRSWQAEPCVNWVPFARDFLLPLPVLIVRTTERVALFAGLTGLCLLAAGRRGVPLALLLVGAVALGTQVVRGFVASSAADLTTPLLALAGWLLAVRVGCAFRNPSRTAPVTNARGGPPRG